MGDKGRRVLLLSVAAAVVAGVAAADALAGGAPKVTAPAPVSAVVSAPGATSSAWYCAGVAAAPSGTQASVLVTNSGARPLSGTIDTVPVGSQFAAPLSFSVPAEQQVTIPLVPGAATVLLNGGGAGVEQVLSGALGSTTAPCTAATASNWFFAQGSTAGGSGLQVALYDPLPTPAVVDVSFVSSSNGAVVPPAYQGIPIAAGTVVVENVADHVPGDPYLATEVTVLSGAVAASEVAEVAGPGQGGLSVVGGAPAPAPRWAFADDADVPGGGNWFDILNPTNLPTTVTVSIVLPEGEAAPIAVRVPAQSVVPFVAQDQTRIPAGTYFGLVFSSSGGRGVVVGHLAASPAAVPAAGISAAQPDGVRRWLVPAVAPGQQSWGLSLVDMAGRAVHAHVYGFAPGGRLVPAPGQPEVTLRPGVLGVIRAPTIPVGTVPLEVIADGAVAIQLDPLPGAPPGTNSVPPWPLLVQGA